MQANELIMPTEHEDKQATQQGIEDGALMDESSLNTMQSFNDVFPDIVQAQAKGELTAHPVGRPKAQNPKQAVTIRYDAAIIDYFKSTGKGWQTRMNDALNEWMKEHANA
jgi:uncharacterized protein (DUF4415 family)